MKTKILIFCFLVIIVVYLSSSSNKLFLTFVTSSLPEGDISENCRFRDLTDGPVTQNDSCLASIIRNEYLLPPSSEPYNFQQKRIVSNSERSALKRALEKYTDTEDKKGFFIECGANDGEFLSNTLEVEIDYGWQGLLVEANSDAFQKLKTKNRKSWLINACLSPVPYSTKLTFYKNPKNSGVSGLNYRTSHGATSGEILQCFPLYSILFSINVTVVDYFSLDIEGKELDILRTIPFDMVMFKVLSVEHWTVPGGRAAVQGFLETQGYTFIEEVNDRLTHDAIYVHSSLIMSNQSR